MKTVLNAITVTTTVKAPISAVWECWTKPVHIVHWAFASDDWEAPAAENDVRIEGRFSTIMAAKDGSSRFNFNGIYTNVVNEQLLEYTIEGGRKVRVIFEEHYNTTTVIEEFEPEHENSLERQQLGWQAILDNFKAYVERSKPSGF